MNRKSFLQKTVIGGAAIGYSGLVAGGSLVNPKEAYSRPSDLKITDIRGATLAAIYDFPDMLLQVCANLLSGNFGSFS